ncbi:MAG TPA: hypothetical protein VEC38_15870 [Candidatus Binataceae bacterium]|nr:hypothetical protein [Candidatus Binataceae bacterium]
MPNSINDQLDLRFNGLVYREDSGWAVHCLELDIVGVGGTPEEAVREATELIEEAIIYAFENDDLAHLFKPAPRELFDRFFHARASGEPIAQIVQCTVVNVPRDDRREPVPVSVRAIQQQPSAAIQ